MGSALENNTHGGGRKQVWAEGELGYHLVSTKASASRSSAIIGCRMYLVREYDLGQGVSLHLWAMAREGLSQIPQLAALPESWEVTTWILMWDLDRVPCFHIRWKQLLGLNQKTPLFSLASCPGYTMHRQQKQPGTVVPCGLWSQLSRGESLIGHLLAIPPHFSYCSSSMRSIITFTSLFYYED